MSKCAQIATEIPIAIEICPSLTGNLMHGKGQRLAARMRLLTAQGNESVPIQLALCWFPGLATFSAII